MRSALFAICILPFSAEDERFRRVDVPWPDAAPTLSVDEAQGRLEVRGERLVRVRGGQARALGCTLDAATGPIVDLARSRFGTTYVAAANGLFMTSPEVEVLDPLDARDGVPSGRPIGIHMGSGNRLFVATEREFGCVELVFFSGRKFTEADGLPKPPFTGFAVQDDGAFLLRTEAGVFRYKPDRDPPPTLRVATVAGEPFRADTPHDVAGPIRLGLESGGAGAITFRYRRGSHHVWRPLDADDPVVPQQQPGDGAIEVIALDREMRSSKPVRIRLHVPYPTYYSKGFLVPAALAVCGLLLVLFLLGARGGGRPALARAVLSAGFAMAILLQILCGSVGHARSWPFVGFTMYSTPNREMGLVFRVVLMGIWPDGSQREIDPRWAGLASDGAWQLLVPLVHGGDAARKRFLDAFNKGQSDVRLRGFLIRDNRFRLTSAGPVAVAPVVMAHYEETP